MKTRIIGILSILLLSFTLNAQAGDGRRAERIHAIKVGYLTDRLHLTEQQSAAFWPVYNSYEAELRDARRAFRQQQKGENPDMGTDQQAMQSIDDNLDLQEQILGINKKYKSRFLNIISAQQLATLYEAERDFKKLLLQQLRQRRGMR